MHLSDGRPENTEGRLEKEIRTYDLLDSLGVEYKRVDHEAAMTMEACEEIDRTLSEGVEKGVAICKNLFLCNRQETDFYLLLIPGDKPFKTKLLSKQIQTSRLSFASPDHMKEYLDIEPGSVSVMGLMNDTENHVQLVIDREVLEDEYLGCHPCINTSSLKLKTKEVLERFLPAVHHEALIVDLPWVVEE